MKNNMKDKLHWTWKKITGTALGILGIGTLTSCYGVIEDTEYFDLHGKITGSTNGTTLPVEGIEVALRGKSDIYESEEALSTSSNKDGEFNLYDVTAGTYTLTFIDVDGEKNGSFKSSSKSIKVPGPDCSNLNIELEADESKEAENKSSGKNDEQ